MSDYFGKAVDNFVKGIGEIIEKSTKHMEPTKYNDVTERFKKFVYDSSVEKFSVVSDSLDLRFLSGKSESDIEIFLSDRCDPKLLRIGLETDANSQKMTIKYLGNNVSGFVLFNNFGKKYLTARTKNSDVQIEDINFEKLVLTSDNGDIDVEGCTFCLADFSTNNGDIEVKLLNDCDMELLSSNGDVEFDRQRDIKGAKCVLKCHSKNGDISVY